jgi:hypothetical protein
VAAKADHPAAKLTPPRWTKFESFLRVYGVVEIAKKLAVSVSAVYHWIDGTTIPHAPKAMAMIHLAKRRRLKLSLEDIYRHAQYIRRKNPGLTERSHLRREETKEEKPRASRATA